MSDGSRKRTGKASTPQNGAASKDAAPFLRRAAEWRGYVNVELSTDAAQQFTAYADDPDMVREITAEVVSRGYKLSAVQTDETGTVRATATAGFSGMVDSGYAVSAWMDSTYSALAAVVFIVAFTARFDLSQFAREGVAKARHTF